MNLQNKTRLQIEQWTEKYGNLPYEIQSRIDNLVNQYEKRTYRINSVNTNGATIVREYQGKIFTVEILAKGFSYNNKVYRSLSAIANEITETHCNGKRFFGVS